MLFRESSSSTALYVFDESAVSKRAMRALCVSPTRRAANVWTYNRAAHREFKFQGVADELAKHRSIAIRIYLPSMVFHSLTSSSQAFDALLKSSIGSQLRAVIADEESYWDSDLPMDAKVYMEYITTNSEDRLFPKLKPHIDTYLKATQELDELYDRYHSTASLDAVKGITGQIDRLADEYSRRLQEIAGGHEEGIRFLAEQAQEAANIHIDQYLARVAIPGYQSTGLPPS